MSRGPVLDQRCFTKKKLLCLCMAGFVAWAQLSFLWNLETTYLCPCCAISIALRAGTGDPPSVTLRTSIDFLSGLRFPCLFSIGESTRFLGGSLCRNNAVNLEWLWIPQRLLRYSDNSFQEHPITFSNCRDVNPGRALKHSPLIHLILPSFLSYCKSLILYMSTQKEVTLSLIKPTPR